MRQDHVPPEINHPGPGGILIVGRDPGKNEVIRGRPFVGDAGNILNGALEEAGIKRKQCNLTNVVCRRPEGNKFSAHDDGAIQLGIQGLRSLVEGLQPALVVALGAQAAHALIPDWPDGRDKHGHSIHRGRIKTARDIIERRGYWWEIDAVPILATLHPAACIPNRDPSGINRMLLAADLGRAKEVYDHGLERPRREVEVISDVMRARQAAGQILARGFAACDIENQGDILSCLGFATSPSEAFVFSGRGLPCALELVAEPGLRTVWQNAQYDLHFLETRNGTIVGGPVDDTIVAWHSLWPEVAGRAEGKKSASKRTHKNLAFFASLYTYDGWWKDYAFEGERERYILNGKDCCITYDIWTALSDELAQHDLGDVYRLTMRRIAPVVAIQRRGIGVDDGLRRERLAQLSGRRSDILKRVTELSRPLLESAAERGRLDKEHLIWRQRVCKCCRGGKLKRYKCNGCAGLPSGYRVEDLRQLAKRAVRNNQSTLGRRVYYIQRIDGLKKAELEEEVLGPCKVCDGRGKWTVFAFNPASNDQVRDLLFNALKLPERAKVDEAALKGLLGWLEDQ